MFVVASIVGGAVLEAAKLVLGTDWLLITVAFYRNEFIRGSVLIGAYVLPIFVSYIGLYLANRIFIRVYGASHLEQAKYSLLRRLIDAALRKHTFPHDPQDLVDEEAWSQLRQYWRRV